MTTPRATAVRRAAAAAAATTLALVLAGCGDDPESGSSGSSGDSSSDASPSTSGDATDATAASPTPDDETSSSPGAAEVVVEDAGSEPRQVLALDVEEGHTETTSMEVSMEIDMGSGGGAPAQSMSFTADTTATVESVGDTIEVSHRYTDMSIDAGDPAVSESVDELARSLRRVTGTTTYDPSGAILDSEMDVPTDAPPELQMVVQQLNDQAYNMTVPLPDEAVGEGAEWVAESTHQTDSGEVTQEARYTLASLEDDGSYEVDVSIDQQIATMGGEGTSTGSGSFAAAPGLLAPARSDVRMELTFADAGVSAEVTVAGTTTPAD